ncbi:4-hydroxy-2-oxoheptanedioate aldolase [Actinomycetospora corticicola]|uniref:2-dehydro-3-deoxyglucarate aldolase/4-hydroxy-2-oxoheptanedioate aldolase n=1 Tax=Actinomycetospora corticicola TaxID=663602 RepID=A0A7Y9DY61_9PSEU|nr:aldolase/citrate lyase family protein [Actinomycetospora corticicola]NYD37550.1 2-dehydro-3-deoxyglucarate aldolase/4-hydroxy-2-oxoheptanedioate aldolase [Actinomycetospora corticicola]
MSTLLTLPGQEAPSTAPVGTWLKMPAVEPAQIAAFAGFDFVIIDLEHTLLTLESAYRSIAVSAPSGVAPLVRVPDHAPATIQRVLDAGAHGVLAPRVDSVDAAVAVARAARFPPHGDRGAGGTSRAGNWGLRPTTDYLGFRPLVIPQIESERAVAAAPDILALDEVDAVFVGAADLGLSAGLAANDPTLVEMVDSVLDAAAAAGKPCGLAFGADAEAGARAAAKGAAFVVLANDTTLLALAARQLVADYRAS